MNNKSADKSKLGKGIDIEEMKKAAQQGKIDEFINKNLSAEATQKLKSVLSDKEATQKLLSTPQAKELLKKFKVE